MRAFPLSFGFFVATAVVFVLQLIPIVGVVLMILAAPLWSAPLINLGMIGTAVEAVVGRVSRWWLVLPIAFYGGYVAFAAADQAALREVSASYDAANAKVSVPFDPARQALVLEGDSNGGSWFVQNYALPVAYLRFANEPEAMRSSRMMEKEVCTLVRENPALGAAGIYTTGFHDDEGSRTMETRFCALTMPERPVLPQVTVTRRENKIRLGSLPVRRVMTTITTPDGQSFTLLGGIAAPLSRIPLPVMGCGLNSGAAKWQCDAAFWREGYTPIVAGDTRYNRDSITLARALGLKRVAIADRRGGDATLVRARMAEIEAETLARQSAAIDRMIADPSAKVDDWQTGVLASRPEALAAKADSIMTGLNRAVALEGTDRWRARASGRILARLIAELPRDRFVAYGPRLLTLYRSRIETFSGSSKPESHWLWEAEPLLRRMGDLGPAALFVAVDPRASGSNVNHAGIETMCRIGQPGRGESGPALLARWRKLDRHDRAELRALFVALRRVGVEPPPLVETEEERAERERGNRSFGGRVKQKASPMEELRKDWGDVTPASPPRVCSPNEEQARREEQHAGKRRTNLE